MNSKKLKLFKLLNNIYKKFFIELNTFSEFIFNFYIFFFSYEKVWLMVLGETDLINSLISLFTKKLLFKKSFYSSSFNRYCYLSNMHFLNKYNKNLIDFNCNILYNDNKYYIFIKKLFDLFYLKKPYIGYRDLNDLISFLFLYSYNNERNRFILKFLKFIDKIFNIRKLIYKSNIRFLNKKHFKFYSIYELINYNYIANSTRYTRCNKYNYSFYHFKTSNINYFFDLNEFVNNKFERHFFTWNINKFYLFFLNNFLKKKFYFFFINILLMLYLWEDSTKYYAIILEEDFFRHGLHSKEVFKYHYNKNTSFLPEQPIQFSYKNNNNNVWARKLLDY